MPFRFRLPGARLVGRVFVSGLVGLGAILAILPFVGRFLYTEDPLQRSDAICVLAGTRVERPLEALDLYRAGYAPIIVLTRDAPDGGQLALARRGIPYAESADETRALLERLGVPPAAVLILPRLHDSTIEEARSLRELVRDRGWHRVIAVTSKLHTRRVRMTLNRAMNGLDVQVIVRASRYDTTDPAHWWRKRADVRFVLFETEKYVAYWVGVR